MKSLIFIALLAVLTVCNDAATIQNKVTSLYLEDVTENQEGDGLNRILCSNHIVLHRNTYRMQPMPNVIQHLDIVYHGNDTAVTSSALIMHALSSKVEFFGKLGTNRFSFRMSTALGMGDEFDVRIEGYYSDWCPMPWPLPA